MWPLVRPARSGADLGLVADPLLHDGHAPEGRDHGPRQLEPGGRADSFPRSGERRRVVPHRRQRPRQEDQPSIENRSVDDVASVFSSTAASSYRACQ